MHISWEEGSPVSSQGLLTDEAGGKRDWERDEPRSGVSAFWTMLPMMEMVFTLLRAGAAGGREEEQRT